MHKKILIAVAPDQTETLAEMLPIADALKDEGGTITALSVVEAVPTYLEIEIPTSIYETSRESARDSLKKALGGRDDVTVEVEIGGPSGTIERVQKEGGYDLVILRSHRPALRDWVLGTTANRIIRDVPCAVHVVR